jgi:hypothetical protein
VLFLLLLLLLFFEIGFCYVAQAGLELAMVAQAGLELAVLLPWPPECWDYRLVLPHLISIIIIITIE